MNIYFCYSIRGERQDVEIYQKIEKKLQTYGKVLTEHVNGADKAGENAEGDRAVDQDMELMLQANVVVAEVTHPSFSVGYTFGQALALKKRVLCLFRPSSGKVLSAGIERADSSLVQVQNYVEEEIEGVLEKYFDELNKK
ncbi:5-hydroxymethyl-dUMP N-hydrolase-like isoform X1 [Trichomycterus rosablanca]|uniref:5-hydroxymethyl-dUMP N-hydrolase-like isoform X1 n=1 Tax=Trichomycterus rosablanca TaxID=2290929 RepID=UPI002F35BDFB